MNLIGLPRDNIIDILVKTDTSQLSTLCSSHSSINQICNDENFWRLKLNHDFRLYNKPENLTWKDYYMWLYIPKQIPVYGTSRIGTISVRRTESLRDLINKGNQLYLSVFGNSPEKLHILTPGYIIATITMYRDNMHVASYGLFDSNLTPEQTSLMDVLDDIYTLHYEDLNTEMSD